HVGSEVVAVAKHPVRKLLIPLKIARKNDQVRAELARPCGRHGRIDAVMPRFIGSRGDDAALFTAHGHRPVAQPGIRGLLDRRKKGVSVQMHNCPHDSFSRLSDKRFENPLNHQFFGWYQIRVFRIFRFEEPLASSLHEGFERGFAVNQCRYDFTVTGIDTMLQNHNVTITNTSARHRVTYDAHAERVARWLKPNGGNIDDDTSIRFLTFVLSKSGRNGAEQRN